VKQLKFLALVFIVAGLAASGCERLRSKDLGKEEPAAAEKVAKAPAPLNPYDKKN
jgi:hypothetical protein